MADDIFTSGLYVTETGTDGGDVVGLLIFSRAAGALPQGLMQLGGVGGKGRVIVKDSKGVEVLSFDGDGADLSVGGNEAGGDILVLGADRKWRIHINGKGGTVHCFDANGEPTVWIGQTSTHAEVALGNRSYAGRVALRAGNHQDRITLDGKTGKIVVFAQTGGVALDITPITFPPGTGSPLTRTKLAVGSAPAAGRPAVAGYVEAFDGTGRQTLVFHGNTGSLTVGTSGNGGDLRVIDTDGSASFLSGTTLGLKRVAIDGTKSTISAKDAAGKERVLIDGAKGTVSAKDAAGKERVLIDGAAGDVKLFGGDCAEEFCVVGDGSPAPGTVMVIAEGGKLRPCDQPYDKRVAGVVSGAGGLSPGITLNSRGSEKRTAVALAGTVFCKADANYGPIDTGDLLTTSATVGCAMRTADPLKAFGTVVGKALGPLDRGLGLIPVLVSLQ